MERILIVEDYKEARAAMVDILMDDYEVSEAESVAEAVQSAQRSTFQLLLSDVRLEGPDGIEGLGMIRKIQPEIRAILITGFASEEAPSRAIRLGVDDYLYKPFRRQELVECVQRVLGSAGDRARYEALLNRVFPPKTEATVLAALEGVREAAFRAFFVGTRSRKLPEDCALGAYERLEVLERKRLEQPVDRAVYQELVRGYQYVATQVASEDQAQTRQLERSLNILDPERFFGFYKKLRDGEITQEMARLAAVLRNLDPRALAAVPELAQLRSTLWE